MRKRARQVFIQPFSVERDYDDFASVPVVAALLVFREVDDCKCYGGDMAILGFDGIEETEDCPCPITTVRQPIEEMCRLTYEFLKAQMEDPSAPIQQQVLKPTLIIRSSTQG